MWKMGITKTLVTILILTLVSASALGQGQKAPDSQNDTFEIFRNIKTSTQIKVGVKLSFDSEVLARYGDGQILTGRLESYRNGVLMFKPEVSGADPIRVPVDQVNWVMVNQGQEHHALAGGLIGLGIGLVVAVSAKNDSAGLDEISSEMTKGIAITIAGVGLGAAIGSNIRSNSWEMVYEDYSNSSLQKESGGEYQVAFGFSF